MPTPKHPEIDRVLTAITGVSRQDAEKAERCVLCSEKITPFRDKLSAREYQISGMCQACQDGFFGS